MTRPCKASSEELSEQFLHHCHRIAARCWGRLVLKFEAFEPGLTFTDELAESVLAEQELLDKFIGDALMAEFGVPVHRGDRLEALAAVRAALAMQANLDDLNRQLHEEGLEPLRQGIGIHCGEVIAGNLGSKDRLEYTVIGAAVNLASRLESLTRQFPDYPILISGEVRDLIADLVVVDELGLHAVKGWPQPVAVYGLVGLHPH